MIRIAGTVGGNAWGETRFERIKLPNYRAHQAYPVAILEVPWLLQDTSNMTAV